jgi:hypothetical protein
MASAIFVKRLIAARQKRRGEMELQAVGIL